MGLPGFPFVRRNRARNAVSALSLSSFFSTCCSKRSLRPATTSGISWLCNLCLLSDNGTNIFWVREPYKTSQNGTNHMRGELRVPQGIIISRAMGLYVCHKGTIFRGSLTRLDWYQYQKRGAPHFRARAQPVYLLGVPRGGNWEDISLH